MDEENSEGQVSVAAGFLTEMYKMGKITKDQLDLFS